VRYSNRRLSQARWTVFWVLSSLAVLTAPPALVAGLFIGGGAGSGRVAAVINSSGMFNTIPTLILFGLAFSGGFASSNCGKVTPLSLAICPRVSPALTL